MQDLRSVKLLQQDKLLLKQAQAVELTVQAHQDWVSMQVQEQLLQVQVLQEHTQSPIP